MIGNKFKEFRAVNGYTQKDLAKILGVSQVTISRIEKGHIAPTDIVLLKFNRLDSSNQKIRHSSRELKLYSKSDSKNLFGKKANFSTFKSTFGRRSGDVISSSIQDDEFYFMLGDMVGHGNEAASMSSAIEFGFQQILLMLGNLIQPKQIMMALEETMDATKDMWTGPPSVLVGSLNSVDLRLTMCSKGLPLPIIYSSSSHASTSWKNTKTKGGDVFKNKSLNLRKGDSILLFSDGVLDSSDTSRAELEENFNIFAGTFKGDSKAIMTNLVEEFMVEKPVDDVSLMVLSISR